ncbi:hypothetical protein [Blastopirellula marina]|uniref:hypothetical protein n=1 Tax=Blastopirellula marina TaxID=124 RepID=UPI0002EEBDF1|nr:hypothetical protein [Blastopirellula marina]
MRAILRSVYFVDVIRESNPPHAYAALHLGIGVVYFDIQPNFPIEAKSSKKLALRQGMLSCHC